MIQAFTDLVGTSAVPALSINIEELTELTPALDTAAIDHGTADQGAEAANTSSDCTLYPYCM
jgi:hypothetical protein